MKAYWGVEVQLHGFLTSALDTITDVRACNWMSVFQGPDFEPVVTRNFNACCWGTGRT